MKHLATFGSIVLTLAFNCSHEPDPVTPPHVSSVDVVPDTVTAADQGALAQSFLLFARRKDSDGKVIAASAAPVQTWGGNDPWAPVTKVGDDGLVSVATPPSPWATRVSATSGGVTSLATSGRLSGVLDATTWPNDRVKASYSAGQIPSVVMVRDTANCADRVVAFVRVALLESKTAPCSTAGTKGSVAVFSSDRAVLVKNVHWHAWRDFVDVRGQQVGLVEVPLKIWIAIEDPALGPADLNELRDNIAGLAMTDVWHARDVFERNRVGIALTVPGDNPEILADGDKIDQVGDSCGQADSMRAHVAQGRPFLTDTLNVYYVRSVDHAHSSRTCYERPGRPEYAIYIVREGESAMSLVHELGHALGLRFPSWGHTDESLGFDNTSVMYSFAYDGDGSDHNQFSLGQVFRMSVDSASWANLALDELGAPVRPAAATRLACQCQNHTRTPCPRLDEDVPPRLIPASEVATDALCNDRVMLTATSEDQTGVALVSGRRWRQPPGGGQCVRDLRSDFEYSVHHVRLTLPNMTWPGGCESWVAVFFDQRALLYLEVPDDPYTWDSNTIQWSVGTNPAPPVAVLVRIYHSAADNTIVNTDFAKAEAVYNTTAGHPTGLLLNRSDETPASGSCAAMSKSTPGEINVYYLATTGGEGSRCFTLATDHVIVNTNARTSTTLAHLLGLALGLKKTSGPQFDSKNVMWPTFTGGAGRTTVTLGQVFRMHLRDSSWVIRSSAPGGGLACEGAARNKCPKPEADR